jgi:hypothetical protein
MTPLKIVNQLFDERTPQMMQMKPEHKFHRDDTFTHTMLVAFHATELKTKLDLTDDEFDELTTTCYAHDLGKVETWNPEGSPWFRGHEEVSADLLIANGFDKDDDIVNAVRYHGRLQQFDKMGHKARLKLLNKISNVKLFIMLQLCDANGFSDYGKKQALNQLDEFVACYITAEFSDSDLPVWVQIIIDNHLPEDTTDAFGTPNAFGDNNDD